MVNSAVDKIVEIENEKGGSLGIDDIKELVGGVYPRVMMEGEMEAGAWSCGMVAGLIHDIPSCQTLMDNIMNEANDIINSRLKGLMAS